MDFEDWRKEIDVLNQQLLELLNRRAECALEIGRIKQAIEQPIYAPERETSILKPNPSAEHGVPDRRSGATDISADNR